MPHTSRSAQRLRCLHHCRMSALIIAKQVDSRSNTSTDNTHDSVACNRNTVSSTTMSRWQHFRSVGVKSTVVDVQAEADRTSEAQVLSIVPNLSVGEEECHSDQCTNDLSCQRNPIAYLVLTMVPRLPQNHLLRHIRPATIGPGIEQTFATA